MYNYFLSTDSESEPRLFVTKEKAMLSYEAEKSGATLWQGAFSKDQKGLVRSHGRTFLLTAKKDPTHD